jgi:hypothetical protein
MKNRWRCAAISPDFSRKQQRNIYIILVILSHHDIIILIAIFFLQWFTEGTEIADTKHGRLY